MYVIKGPCDISRVALSGLFFLQKAENRGLITPFSGEIYAVFDSEIDFAKLPYLETR